MAQHRTYTIAFKRQLAKDSLAGGTSSHGLQRRHDVCRNFIRIWAETYERLASAEVVDMPASAGV